jgi:prepilin-type N-terminal cleavage/methylation domain-containing protein
MKAKAFTLIEMLVVLALSAILAGIVTVSLVGSFHTARAQDVAGGISTYDRLAREYFRTFGRSGSLVFDLGRGTVTRIETQELKSQFSNSAPLHLPSEFHLSQVVTAERTTASGEVSIPCSADGQTPSYALNLTDDTGKQYWVVTAGLTGKSIQANDEQEVRDIFTALR